MQVSDILVSADAQAWTLAALVTALRGDPVRAAAAQRVLDAAGVEPLPDGPSPFAVAAQAESTLRQAAAAAAGLAVGWDDLPDEILVLQGEASAQGARPFSQFVLPMLDGLAERLSSPGATMLDVGTGVGALAAAYAEVFPALTVVGIDRSQRVLDLASQRRAAQGVDRVDLRCMSFADLEDDSVYDLAWVPAPFLEETALREGLRRSLTALKPGGWLLLGHGKGSGDPAQEAMNAFKTQMLGGTVLLEPEAAKVLNEVGFAQVTNLPTPPGAPGLSAARRPGH